MRGSRRSTRPRRAGGRRGRRPRSVASSSTGGEDGGSSACRAADRHGTVEHRRETPTPTESQDALLAGLDGAVEELMEDGVIALGFGIPSRLDQKTGRVEGSVNIPLEGL